MTLYQTPVFVLAMLLSIAGFSLSVSVTAIPALPRFRFARRQMMALAALTLAAGIALTAWSVRA